MVLAASAPGPNAFVLVALLCCLGHQQGAYTKVYLIETADKAPTATGASTGKLA